MIFKTYYSSSAGNLYSIEDGDTAVLLEAGVQYKKILRAVDYNISRFKACFLTHEHSDHAKGAPILSNYVPIYTAKATAEHLLLNWYKSIEKPVTVGSITVSAFNTIHNAVDPIGFHFKTEDDSLMFVTDSKVLPVFDKDVKTLVVECNNDDDVIYDNIVTQKESPRYLINAHKYHLSLQTLLATLPKFNNIEKLILIHLSLNNLEHLQALNEIKNIFKGEIEVPTYEYTY